MTLNMTQTRPASRARPLPIAPDARPLSEQLTALLKAKTQVWAMTGYYLVTFPRDVQPYQHFVRKDRTCACGLGPECPAVQAVADHLKAGGERAADVPAHQLIPVACPVCGGPVKFKPGLCSPARGAGWTCVNTADDELPDTHYWHTQGQRLLRLRAEGGAQP